MVLALQYRDLSSTISETDRLARELGQYCDELSRKVQQKMYAVEGGMSAALNNADYYVNQKIRQLRNHENNAKDLSSKVQNLLETAKRVDTDVERTIQANQKSFFQKNPELKAPGYKQAVISFLSDMKKVPVIGWLIRGGDQVLSAADQLRKEIKHWWKCGGGKELVMNCLDIAIKIGATVAAVITAINAVVALTAATVLTFGTILLAVVAVAACVTAVISAVNAGTNFITSLQAITASRDGEPAMAKIYGKRDTLAQVLKEENFHDRFLNRMSMISATVIEVTDAVASVVLLAQSIGKIIGGFLGKNGVGFAFKELVRSDGKLTKRVTLRSIWKGTKALVFDKKLTKSTFDGLRTTLISNIKQSLKYQATLFKMAVRNPVNWIKTKEMGDLGFFKNIAEKIRYNIWQFRNSSTFSTRVAEGNSILGNIKFVLEGLDRTDRKGLTRRISEKYVQKTLFDNDFIKLLGKTGLGGVLVNFDKSGILKDYTGIGDGIVQKISDIAQRIADMKKALAFSLPSFQELHPQYECVMEDT